MSLGRRSLAKSVVFSLAALGVFAGCQKSDNPQGVDQDFSVTLPDLGFSLPDLSGGGGDGGGLNSDMHSGTFSCRGTDAPGTMYKNASNTITLPASGRPYTLDLDGDGKADNQLKNIMAALSAAGLDIQPELDMTTKSGELVYLIGVKTDSVSSAKCTGVLVHAAEPRRAGDPPKYDGNDVFTKDGSADAELIGAVNGGTLSTKAPKDLTIKEEARIDLNLSIMGMPLRLPLRGVHVQGSLATVSGQLYVQNGVLNGAVSKKDVDGMLVPTIATQVTNLIHSDPTGSTSMTLIALFENTANAVSKNKCMADMSKCCHTNPATCVILPDEILASPLGNVLAPDVQVLNAAGEWAPVPGGTSKNAMSVGIGFTSVPAMF